MLRNAKQNTSLTDQAADNAEFKQYLQLDIDSIKKYVHSLPMFAELESDKLIVKDIGDGNLNNVYRIITPQFNFILKQSLPYLKCVGENHPLSNKRMYYEISYHCQASKILKNHLPELYYSDDHTMMLMCMEDLNKHEVMREGLIKKTRYPNFAEHISTHLANVLFKTSRFYLNKIQHDLLIAKFSNNSLCELTKDFIFTFPYINHTSNYLENNYARFDDFFREKTAHLLTIFATQNEALVHGDLHTGSIMLNQESTFIIDHEFAFMGPMAFDLGLLLANLLTSLIYHKVKKSNESYINWLCNTIEKMLTSFSKKFISLISEHQPADIEDKCNYMDNTIREAYGFAGIEIARRICGIAGVKEIRGLINKNEREMAEDLGLSTSHYLVKNYETINSPQMLIRHLNDIILLTPYKKPDVEVMTPPIIKP